MIKPTLNREAHEAHRGIRSAFGLFERLFAIRLSMKE